MGKDDNDEKLIGKLIEKRKQENDAFIKLLDAIESSQKLPKETKKKSPKKK